MAEPWLAACAPGASRQPRVRPGARRAELRGRLGDLAVRHARPIRRGSPPDSCSSDHCWPSGCTPRVQEGERESGRRAGPRVFSARRAGPSPRSADPGRRPARRAAGGHEPSPWCTSLRLPIPRPRCSSTCCHSLPSASPWRPVRRRDLAATAFSLPMVLDRDADAITAALSSANAVLRNRPAALLSGSASSPWYWSGSRRAFFAFVVIFPLLGHATWHAYRATIDAWPGRSASRDGWRRAAGGLARRVPGLRLCSVLGSSDMVCLLGGCRGGRMADGDLLTRPARVARTGVAATARGL